jgi:hypothetical protein
MLFGVSQMEIIANGRQAQSELTPRRLLYFREATAPGSYCEM